MNSIRKQCLFASGAAIALWASPALAQDTTGSTAVPDISERASVDYLDLTASLGYSSNPLLRTNGSEGSFLGRASARGVHAWSGELSSSSISGFIEGTSYFNDYGLKSIFSVNANTTRQVSETVRLHASGGVSGDLSGQLSNRFLYVPPLPEVPDPTLPFPPTVEDPDLFSFSGRTYRIYGQAGASIRTGTRSNVGISGGASRAIFTGSTLDDYTTFFVNGSYGLALSERTTVGARLGVTRTQYDNSDDHSTIINPAATVRTQLRENLSASLALGVTFASVDRGLNEVHSTNLSVNGSLCKTTESERLCGRVSRYAQTSASTALVTTNSVGVDWFKKLDEAQTLQLSASVVHYVSEDALADERKSNYLRLAASYSRRINERLSGGVDLGARKLRREGVDPDTDISGTVFVRYRIGDLG
jgi:hypothetical protein